MNLVLVGLVTLISLAVGWMFGLVSAHYLSRPTVTRHPSALHEIPNEVILSADTDTRSMSPDYVEQHSEHPPAVETLTETIALPRQTRELENDLKNMISSVQVHEVETRKRSDGRIRHLLVTRYGERWIVDRIPRDDYGNFAGPTPQSVDQLISKPVGYRLAKGYNLLQDDDTNDEEEDS